MLISSLVDRRNLQGLYIITQHVKGLPMQKIMVLFLAMAIAASGSAMAQVDTRDPSTAREFFFRGVQRADAKQFQDAIDDFTKATELDPGFYDAHFTLSSLYAELKDYQAAVDALARGLQVRPKSYSALFNSGLYLEYLGDYDSAIAHYTQASAEDADFSRCAGTRDEARAHAYHYRGRVYQWYKKDNANAVADYTIALRLDPKIEKVRYRRAVAYHALKDYANANADFAVARELAPDYPNLLNSFAWQLATCPEAEYRDGQLALQLALKTQDNETLAAAYAETGAFDEAVASQKRALELLDGDSEPNSEKEAERRRAKREQMEIRMAAYESQRPYRDE